MSRKKTSLCKKHKRVVAEYIGRINLFRNVRVSPVKTAYPVYIRTGVDGLKLIDEFRLQH